VNRQGPGKIDWTDFTWNPVTGCYNNCPYCYARRIAGRFRSKNCVPLTPTEVVLHGCPTFIRQHGHPFANGFAPTFWPGRLTEPDHRRQPAKIFVCSMGELFGDWVESFWIEAILLTVHRCPQHTFQFLTKNPRRLPDLHPRPANAWGGVTATDEPSMTSALTHLAAVDAPVRFVSAEPVLGPLFSQHHDDCQPGRLLASIDWLILGAQTGPGAVAPQPSWLADAEATATLAGVPVWHKDSVCPSYCDPRQLKFWPNISRRSS